LYRISVVQRSIGRHTFNFEVGSARFLEPRNTRRLKRPRGRASIIPTVAIYPHASEHNMPILIANMRTTLLDKCVSFNETRVYLARWKASANGASKMRS